MAIDRLSALDRLMLGASRRWPQDIGAIAILDGDPVIDETGQFQIGVVRDAIARRIHLVPRFRQVIYTPRRGLGGPLWVDAPTFDLSHHVRVLPLEAPCGEDALLRAVEQILESRLDPTRPMWEIWLLPGLPDGRVGLFVRIHHTIADGMAAMATVATLLDRTPNEAPPSPAAAWRSASRPSHGALLVDNLNRRRRSLARSLWVLAHPRTSARRLQAAWPAIRELLAERPATKSSLDRMVGPGRTIALIRTSLDEVKAIGRAHDATVNDVLLATIAGGLRALLRKRGEDADHTTLRIYVPVSLRRRMRGVQQGNLIAQMAVPLRLRETDPVRRLMAIAAETTERKARLRTNLGSLMIGGGIGRRLMLLAITRQRVNVTSASIPGPTMPLHLAGMTLLDVFPVLPLIFNEPLGIGALSYAGELTIGVVADRDAFSDLDVLVGAMRDELRALGAPLSEALAQAPPTRVRAPRRPAPDAAPCR